MRILIVDDLYGNLERQLLDIAAHAAGYPSHPEMCADGFGWSQQEFKLSNQLVRSLMAQLDGLLNPVEVRARSPDGRKLKIT
ncbi:MAG: hypothetical protein KKB70_05805 [Proteobacteria bacterium]|nr:hypothetical protein [Pseudomonadota bacterium]MBU1610250.1 hypothetical protein [Pseudomonadota bacterium]